MNIKEARKRLLRNPEFKNEYEKKDLAFAVAKMLIDARIAKGLSQKELANLIGTKQPSIARIEKGENLPSLSLLQKIAEAMHTYLIPPKFAFMLEVKEVDSKVTHVTQQETVIRVIHEHVIRDETKFAYSIDTLSKSDNNPKVLN